VTRHLPVELDRRDWSLLVLHYLGLDHIGHLAGPTSPLISPKLREMDDVIRLIHQKSIEMVGVISEHGQIITEL